MLLIFALFSMAYSVTDHADCSQGDLDFLCRNADACSDFLPRADAEILCAGLQDGPTMLTLTTEEPTLQTENPSRNPMFSTGIITRSFVTGTDRRVVTGYAGTTEQVTEPEHGTDANIDATEAGFRSAPEIITAPRNITVPPGGLARFLCFSTGAPTPQTTITKREETVEPDRSSFKQTVADRDSSISMIQEIENVVEANEGWYRCLSCNYYGCVHADGYLTVLDLCEANTCESPQVCVADYEKGTHSCECPDYCEGDVSPDFVCSNYCGTYYSPCQMKNEACANGRSDERVWVKGYCPVDLSGPNQATVYNQKGEEVSDVVTVGAGETLVLECKATSKPSSEFSWYKSGSLTPVASGELLIIQNAEPSQSGQYYCKAVACKTTDKAVDSAIVEVEVMTKVTTSAPVSSTPAGEVDDLTFDFPTTQCHVSYESKLFKYKVHDVHTLCYCWRNVVQPLNFANFVKYENNPNIPQIFGDPHFNTFDGHKYDFMGHCDYVLAMDCEAAQWFIYGRMTACGPLGGSCLESVTIYYKNQIIELQRGWLVNHFGVKVSPKNFKNKVLTVGDIFNVRFDGRYLHVEFLIDQYINQFGQEEVKKVQVIWDGYVSVEIHTPLTGRTCGLCGDNDGQMDNDFTTRQRQLTKDENKFGDSWKIDRMNTCPVTQTRQSNEEICGASYDSVKAECEVIFSSSKFDQCSSAHENYKYIEACIYDQCADSGLSKDYPPKCAVASAYAARCEHPHYFRSNPQAIVTFDVSGWEQAVGCPGEDELYETILNTGCPQPSVEDDVTTGGLINPQLNN